MTYTVDIIPCISYKKMNYEKFFRELIYGSENWAAQSSASRLQQAWCTWRPEVREHRLLFGHNDAHNNILGLVFLKEGYPELKKVYKKYVNNEY